MDQEKRKKWLIDYIDGQLSEEQQQRIEKEIREDEHLRKDYEQLREVMYLMGESRSLVPDELLKHDFERLLQEEIRYQQGKQSPVETKRVPFYRYWPYAAAIALLLTGIVAGIFMNRHYAQQTALQALQKERQAAKEVVLSSMQNQVSASKRLSGILASQTIKAPDEEIVDALIQVLDHDDNTNVRLAALNVLLQYRKEPKVHSALLQSLMTQDDPLVQLSLIDAVVGLQDSHARETLQRLINNDATPDMVKEEAHVGLFQL